jgi:hypothetical protein
VKAPGIQWPTVEGPPWLEHERERWRDGHGVAAHGRGGARPNRFAEPDGRWAGERKRKIEIYFEIDFQL